MLAVGKEAGIQFSGRGIFPRSDLNPQFVSFEKGQDKYSKQFVEMFSFGAPLEYHKLISLAQRRKIKLHVSPNGRVLAQKDSTHYLPVKITYPDGTTISGYHSLLVQRGTEIPYSIHISPVEYLANMPGHGN